MDENGDGVERGYAKLIGRRQIERNDADSGPPTDVADEQWDCLVTSLPARLGRDGGEKLEGQGEQRGCFVNLGKAKSISRHHATIQWDYKSGQYRIDCHSKNGMVVNRVHYTRYEHALLRNESAIRIGTASFYFFLPQAAQEGGNRPLSEDEEDEEDEEALLEEQEAGKAAEEESVDDQQSRASAPGPAPAPPKPRKSEGGPTYAEMVLEAFKSSDLQKKAEEDGLTAAEVAAWLVVKYPEWGEADKRQKLQAGIQNAFSRRYVKQEAVPGAPRGARWKFDPEGAALKAASKQPRKSSQGTPAAPPSSSASSSAAARGAGAAAAALLPKVAQASVGESSAFDESDLEIEDDAMEVEAE